MNTREARTPRVKLRRGWVRGDDPGMQVFEVDPPLLPGEVEVDLGDLAGHELEEVGRLSSAELVALDDLTRTRS